MLETGEVKNKTIIGGRYVKEKIVLGKGSFSKVFLGWDRQTRKQVAIKRISINPSRDGSRESIENEISLLEELSHPNVIRSILTERRLEDQVIAQYIVMPYLPGSMDLIDWMCSRNEIVEERVRKVFSGMVSAVKYCHEENIVHHDIKLENFLVDKNLHVVLIDFGFAKRLPSGVCMMEEFKGTEPYAAPELFAGSSYNGFSIDTWALGVCLYSLLTDRQPFHGNVDSMFLDQNDREYIESLFYPKHISEEARSLVSRILHADVSVRLNVQQISEDSWILN